MEKLHYLKVKCNTPKGKADACIKSFQRYFSLTNKPKQSIKESEESFHYIYAFKTEKEKWKVTKKLPKAENKIRSFYTTIIYFCNRANKLSKKGAWKIEKTRRWILKQMRKKNISEKQMEDFINVIEMDDIEDMKKFLMGDLITWEDVQPK